MDRAQVIDIIRQRAAAHGVDPAVMIANAGIESNYNPREVHPKTKAAGLFQFMPGENGSWAQYGLGKDPLDPEANADAAARFMQDNAGVFRRKMNRDPTPGEQYLLWQQGATGGTALLNNPDRPAADVLAPYYKPGVNIQAITGNGGRADMTAGEFAKMWIDKANARYGGVTGSIPATSTPSTESTTTPTGVPQASSVGTGAPLDLSTPSAVSGAPTFGSLSGTSDPSFDASTMKSIQNIYSQMQPQQQQIQPLQINYPQRPRIDLTRLRAAIGKA